MTGVAFSEALRALVAALDELGAPAAIIGGVAVIVHGVPRATVDVDATVSARTTPRTCSSCTAGG